MCKENLYTDKLTGTEGANKGKLAKTFLKSL